MFDRNQQRQFVLRQADALPMHLYVVVQRSIQLHSFSIAKRDASNGDGRMLPGVWTTVACSVDSATIERTIQGQQGREGPDPTSCSVQLRRSQTLVQCCDGLLSTSPMSPTSPS